ncbi:hypothetical protein HaLaN_19545 [Haematococcus lacustris]|uniref:Uncharacterized protein n=1 Tax=Haematococcus lacustris TaxID=44745 RepID=A0A699ZR29_HAELA|nr:hypothetical protein HaLaN_19545 [Haematococcus lacustris]
MHRPCALTINVTRSAAVLVQGASACAAKSHGCHHHHLANVVLQCDQAVPAIGALSYWEARSTEHSRKQAAVTAKLVAEGPAAEDCVQVVVPPGTPPGTDLTYSSPVLGDTSGDSTDDSQSYQAGSEGVAETMALLSNGPESSALPK